MTTFEIDRRDMIRGGAATALASGLIITAGQDASAARPEILRPGDRGWWVANVQRRLLEGHYWLRKADGYYDETTQQAVMALQKVHGLGRDGIVGPNTWSAIYKPIRPRPRTAAYWEIDIARQIQISARYGYAQWVFNTSTGTSRTPTPKGKFTFYREIDGLRISRLGELWRPKYFYGGYAIHGSPSIPGYPASHGCARLHDRAINYIWWKKLAPVGRRVYIY